MRSTAMAEAKPFPVTYGQGWVSVLMPEAERSKFVPYPFQGGTCCFDHSRDWRRLDLFES